MIRKLSELRADRTRFDVGRKRSGKSGQRLFPDTNMYRPILAIDGEGITDPGGTPERPAKHRYVILAASDGSYVAGDNLTTETCFEYLLNLPKRHLIVGFSLNYDVAKWLGNISQDVLETLWRTGKATWGPYTICYTPGKQFGLKHRDKRSIHVYDVFGYYQRSFVAALEEWGVGSAGQIERIREMKASRATFSDESTSEMLAYCLEECRLLVQLVGKLRDALIEGGIPMRQWYGAGAIASAIMEKEGIKRYLERQPPERFSIPILSAYFGGRFELFESGEHRDVHLYDIRSAYPHIASTLPCQTHLIYEEVEGWIDAQWAIYLCEWSVPQKTPYPPFPFRDEKTRQILYPTNGRGWYHSSEVRAAINLFGPRISVLRSIVLIPSCPPSCDGRPFKFIPEYYAYRNELKSRGSQAQLTIKLGLNSLYGKTAQGVGFGDKKPPFQSYLWAGMITGGTRAMLLDAISQNPKAIIWTATDGIASKVPLDLPEGDALGQWEYTYADWVFAVQPGVYQVCKAGKVSIRSRGFGKQETAFEDIRKAYFSDPIWGVYKYTCTRFVGLGTALSRVDFWRVFGRWKEMQREITFFPSKRYPESVLDLGALGLSVESISQMAELPPIRYYPPTGIEGQEQSAPYSPKTSWVDQWARESDNDEAFELLIDSEQP